MPRSASSFQRGFGDQEDIDLQGLRYLQTVVDRDTRDELHVEPGFFLSVPPTHTPSAGPSLVRQGVIPHGCSILMHGDAVTKLTPDIGDTSTTPMFKDGSLVPPGYLALAPTPDLPAGIPHGADVNPNVVLQAALAEQERRGEKVESTVKLTFKTGDGPTGAGISNIAFLQPDPARVDGKRNNAAVTHVSSTFWLQRVRTAAGAIVLQLQYSQTVLINFDQSINWPHVTVATLRKVVTPTPPARLPVPAPASRPAPFVLGSGPSPAFDRVPPSPHAAPPFTPPSH